MTEILQSYGIEIVISNYASLAIGGTAIAMLILVLICTTFLLVKCRVKVDLDGTTMAGAILVVAFTLFFVIYLYISADSRILSNGTIYNITDMQKFHERACSRYNAGMFDAFTAGGITHGKQESKWSNEDGVCIIHTIIDGGPDSFNSVGQDELKGSFVRDLHLVTKAQEKEHLKNAFEK